MGTTLIQYYNKVGSIHGEWVKKLREKLNDPNFKLPGSEWPAIQMATLPKGLDEEAWVYFFIKGAE